MRSERDAELRTDGTPSLLGKRQLEWLKGELLAGSSGGGLVVWVSSVPWIAPADPARDDWGGYASERQEIADFIAQHQIRNLVMVAGDAHMVALDDGKNSDYSRTGGGGFPILHAGALDRAGSVKGGPYSHGAFPGGGHYGLLRVEDNGKSLSVRLAGKDAEGNELVAYQFVPAAQAPVAVSR
jgi:hypothetical protein